MLSCGNSVTTKIEVRRSGIAKTCNSGHRYEIAAKAVFADPKRCGDKDKSHKSFDSLLTVELNKSSGKSKGKGKDKKRRSRDRWWGTMVAPTAMGHLL